MNADSYEPVKTCQIPGLAAIYWEAFGEQPGTFVEVGAYDGCTYSNTYNLAANLGWKGLYVEPVEHLYINCCANHAHHAGVRVMRKFVSNTSGEQHDIYKWGGETYTGDQGFIDTVAKGAVFHSCCETATLDRILWDNCDLVAPGFELLVIDVEGHELEVLAGLTLQLWKPKMLIIETHYRSNDNGLRQNAEIIHVYMQASGYKVIYTDNINSIFIKEVTNGAGDGELESFSEGN